MKLIEFMNQYPDEQSCKDKWKEIRIQEGVVCPECGCKNHYWKNDKECFECKHCHHRQSLKANTIMHGSKLPFRYWFIAIHLLTSTKKGISALEVQRQLGHKYYVPIWALLHKLRAVMGERDSRYNLSGNVELDEGMFTTEVPDDQKDEKLKRGRGSQRKTKVLVMAETTDGDGKKSKGSKPTAVRHIKMLVIGDLKSETIDGKVKLHIDNSSILNTDKSTSYTNFNTLVTKHNGQVISPKDLGKVLPWVHIAISNAKRQILDIHHNVDGKYIQNYLSEFSYKFNRRYMDTFKRLLVAGVSVKNSFRYNPA